MSSTGDYNTYALTIERRILYMKWRPRIYYKQEQKTLMWDRWPAGDSPGEIARMFDRGHSSIPGIFAETGGIRPRARSRSRLALTMAEREEIS